MNRATLRTKPKSVYIHIIYWILTAIFFPSFTGIIQSLNLTFKIFWQQFIAFSFSLSYLIPLTYIFAYFIIPKLFEKRHYIFLVLSSILIIIIVAVVDVTIQLKIYLPLFHPNYVEKFQVYAYNIYHLITVGVIFSIPLFLLTAIIYVRNSFQQLKEKESLKLKMTESELNMLKGQVHPHFLFNTLNNIYTMSLDSDNQELSNSITKISDILRFTLYDCSSTYIPIKKELEAIKNYIELEKLRYSKIDINVDIQNLNNDIQIAPLILFTFVENAFKHGTSNSIKDKWVNININIEENTLVFNVSNSKNPNNPTNLNNHREGIGLKNAIKILELFYGSDNYSINMNEDTNSFDVTLKLNLRAKSKNTI